MVWAALCELLRGLPAYRAKSTQSLNLVGACGFAVYVFTGLLSLFLSFDKPFDIFWKILVVLSVLLTFCMLRMYHAS